MALIGEMRYLTIGSNTYSLPSSGGSGTVTNVTVSNATNGGLTVSGSPITSSGTITIGHSNVLNSAQTTQAVYPIKIDKNGHISEYGTAVTVPKVGTWYGTCSTTASTATKTVTCSGFELTTGNIIGILFTTGNTAATPTLTVNSQTNKSIYVGNSTPNATDNVLKWSANTLVYFQYDGTYFRYITSISAGTVIPSRGANTWYGTSSTGATTQAKTSTIDNFVLTKGAVVYITFSTANTYTSAKLTLNINSTGAKDVYYNNAVTSSTNTLLWNANETLIFIYSGSYYYYVGKSGAVTLNGSATASPSFYAPTSAGTSGNYLKSSGSGAPTWETFPTIPSITLNGSSTTSPSFYAPTTAGTSGYYLKSNGSGAPEWAAVSAGGVTDVTVGGTSVVTSGVAAIASPIQIVRW